MEGEGGGGGIYEARNKLYCHGKCRINSDHKLNKGKLTEGEHETIYIPIFLFFTKYAYYMIRNILPLLMFAFKGTYG